MINKISPIPWFPKRGNGMDGFAKEGNKKLPTGMPEEPNI